MSTNVHVDANRTNQLSDLPDYDYLRRLLTCNSTDKYNITHGRFFFNHLAHGLVALFELGATKSILLNFLEYYTKVLESSEKRRNQENIPDLSRIKNEEIEKYVRDLRGQKTGYYFLVSHFERLLKEKYDSDPSKLVAEEYFKSGLIWGLMGAALHSLIHIGYGFSVKHPRTICEGLAYAVCTYLSPGTKVPLDNIGRGKQDIFIVLEELRSNVELRNYVEERCKADKDSMTQNSRFSTFVSILYQTKLTELVEYGSRVNIQYPEKNNESCLIPFLDSLLNVAISLYVRSAKLNDFFFVHVVTSSWSFKQIVLNIYKHVDLSEIHKASKVFICGLLAVYLAQGAPELRPMSEVKVDMHGPVRSWDDIKAEALNKKRDEHIYKLIFTACQADIPSADGSQNEMNKLAAEIALKYDLSH